MVNSWYRFTGPRTRMRMLQPDMSQAEVQGRMTRFNNLNTTHVPAYDMKLNFKA